LGLVETWLVHTFTLQVSLALGASLGATLGDFPLYHVPGGPLHWPHIHTGPVTGRRLQAKTHFCQGLTMSPSEWATLVPLVKRAHGTAATRPFRFLALLPDNTEMLRAATSHGGKILLRIPRGRLPWIDPVDWVRGRTFVSRDSTWCPLVGARLVIWQNAPAASQWPFPKDMATTLAQLCNRALRGGAHGLSLYLPTGAVPLEEVPSMPPPTYDAQGCLSPREQNCDTPGELDTLLEYLGPWLGHPVAAQEPGVQAALAEGRVLHLADYWEVAPHIPFSAKMGEMEGTTLRQLYCLAASPAGLLSFVRKQLGSQDAIADAQAVVAELAAAHRRTWKAYVKAQDVCITSLYATTQLGGLPPHRRKAVAPPMASPVATRSALSAMCPGDLCLPRTMGVGGLCLSMATRDLQCSTCLDHAARCRLLKGMLVTARLPGFLTWRRSRRRPLSWRQALPRLTDYVASLVPTLPWMEVALPATLSATVTRELAEARPVSTLGPLAGDPDPLVWSLYLLHHDRFLASLSALWCAIPHGSRPVVSPAQRLLFGLAAEAVHQPQSWLREPPQTPPLRCCSSLCAPGSTAKKSTSAVRYRQAFRAHLCNRCVLQGNKVRVALSTHAAVAQATKRPLSAVLQAIVASIPAGLSDKALSAAFQGVVSTPLQKLLGHVLLLEAYYCLHHGTQGALLQRCQSPSKRPTPRLTPVWFQEWSCAHPYVPPSSPASAGGATIAAAPLVVPVATVVKRRRRARYRPAYPTQALRAFTPARSTPRRRRSGRRSAPSVPTSQATSQPTASAAILPPGPPPPALPMSWNTFFVLAAALLPLGLHAPAPPVMVRDGVMGSFLASPPSSRRGPPSPPPPGPPG
jgi:hypothetical protein